MSSFRAWTAHDELLPAVHAQNTFRTRIPRAEKESEAVTLVMEFTQPLTSLAATVDKPRQASAVRRCSSAPAPASGDRLRRRPPVRLELALFEHIRASPACRGVRFVVTTTHAAHVRSVAGVDEEVLEIVGKPYDLAQVVAAVTKAAAS